MEKVGKQEKTRKKVEGQLEIQTFELELKIWKQYII